MSKAASDAILSVTRAELDELQLERLRWTLQHAYLHSAHYRALFDSLKLRPDDCGTLADIAHFPLTTKADLRAHYPFGFFAVPMERVARVHASSGTTGKPTVVGYTRDDLNRWSELVARSIRAAGGRAGMRVHIAYGYGLFTGGLGAHYGAEAAGCTVIPMSGGQTERQVQLIQDFKPDIIMVTPSYMLALLDEFVRQGLDPKNTSLRIGIFGAEPWGEGVRREIETAFGIQASDIYGLSEVMGPGVAQEFGGTAQGPTIWEDHFLPEIIDPASGAVLPDGEEGELVFTSLTKEAMPVIRYRTRDLTRLLPGTLTAMRRMAKIMGRSDDMLIIRGVNVFPSQIEEIICEQSNLCPQYRIELTRPQRLDEMELQVEARAQLHPRDFAREGAELAERIKQRIGITVRTTVCAAGTVPRSTGKALRVLDRRPR